MANSRAIQTSVTDTGCFVQTSHKLNQDGYFRKGFKDGKHEMFHVLMWQHFNGPVPVGSELHHTCGNRACFNPSHLELVDRSQHKTDHNSVRYLPRLEEAKVYWLEHKCSGTELGKRFGVSWSSGCRWIRYWITGHPIGKDAR